MALESRCCVVRSQGVTRCRCLQLRGLADVVEAAQYGVQLLRCATQGREGAHAMMITGQEGTMLQVYNPWGTTTWVSEDGFINGRMAKASTGGVPDVSAVRIPR
ncbi:hypothetical protein AB0D04_13525 [Streptomyces sp. NPDC048483]|uniref:hypothetical protein n=1 Tax=Streptomyces sp. NPDC048483 TaxID=3154927 RepID=UPI003430FD0D